MQPKKSKKENKNIEQMISNRQLAYLYNKDEIYFD
jgi:hypothetical protein